MISTQTGIPIDLARPLDMSKLKVFKAHEAPEALYQQIVGGQEGMLKAHYTQMPDVTSHPAYQPYATVKVGGKVVAEIDNHGFTKMSNALGAKLGGTLPGSVNGQNGPLLAQARAEAIAGALGGKVVISSTALTQSQYGALPEPQATVDVQALMQDPSYEQLQKTREARTLFLAQQAAQSSSGAQAPAEGLAEADEADAASTAEQAFLDYMQKTPAERMREAILKDLGLTEEQLAALPADEREAVEQQIQDEIKKRMALQAEESAERKVS